MTAVRDYKNRTLTLTDCSSTEAREVLTGAMDESEVLVLLHEILTNQRTEEEKLMAFEDDLIAKITAQKTVADGVLALFQNLGFARCG